MFEEVRLEIQWQYDKFTGSLRSFKTGIMNFWHFRKEIWNYRWWDYSFLMTAIETRLQFMHDHWDESHYLKSEQEKEIIKEALDVIKKITDYNDSHDENQKSVSLMYQEFGDILFTVKERTTTYEINDKTETFITTCANIERLWD